MLCRSRLLPERHTPGFMTPVLGPKHPRIAELRRLFGRRSSRSPEIILEGPRTVGEALDAGNRRFAPARAAKDGDWPLRRRQHFL